MFSRIHGQSRLQVHLVVHLVDESLSRRLVCLSRPACFCVLLSPLLPSLQSVWLDTAQHTSIKERIDTVVVLSVVIWVVCRETTRGRVSVVRSEESAAPS